MIGETAAAPYLQNHNTCKHSKFSRVQKFREFNFRDPTPTAKLRENKAHAKISGNTVLGFIYKTDWFCRMLSNRIESSHL